MAKSNAQRQADYRRRCLTRQEDYSVRLNTQLDYGAKYRMGLLAHYYGLTQKQMLEQLITDRYNQLKDGLDDDAFDLFIDKKLTLTGDVTA